MIDINWYIIEAPTEEQAILAEMTHDLIISTLPNGIVKRKWKVPVYSYIKDICYMNYTKKHLYIGFPQGKQMQISPLLDRSNTTHTAKYHIQEEADILATSFIEFLFEAIAIQESLYK